MARIFFLCFSMTWPLLAAAQGILQDSRLLIREGNNHLSRFEPVQALENFNRAITISKRTGDAYRLARAYLGAGQAIWYQSRFTGAIDSMNKAIAMLRTFPKKMVDFALPSALRILSNIYDETGDYEKAFQTISEAIQISVPDDHQNITLCMVQLAELYLNIGDYKTALEYFHRSDLLNPQPRTYEFRELNTQRGRLYAARTMYDSAQYYYRRSIPGHPSPRNVYLKIGECYLLQKNYDSAYAYLQQVDTGARRIGDVPVLLPTIIGLGQIYMYTGRRDSALRRAHDALALANEKGKKQDKRDALLMLSMLYEKEKPELAYSYFRQYVRLKDSVLSEQFKGRLYAFRQQQEEAAYRTEMERMKNRQRIMKQSIIALMAGSVLVIVVLILRYKNRNLKLRKRSSELEMQALRAQMNPHFIFNCMSAINHFIVNKEPDKASGYLTRFSRLIRLVLVNSEKDTITLEEELSVLKLYLEMEQLRFSDAFEYRISYDEAIHPSQVKVPSFILQPFCENAIWHGLLHKDGPGLLTIDFTLVHDNTITCTITDNGVGLTRAAEIKKRKTEEHIPFGHKLVAERLSLFNKGKQVPGVFGIENVTGADGEVAGTRVIFSFINEG
jgi:tetratricopeptide (TPR) repeat protein